MDKIFGDALLIDIALKIGQAFAFVVGGVWVYWNYVRGRTHIPRLQLELKAEFLRKDNRCFLLASVSVKNPGLGLVQVTQEGTVLLVARHSSLDNPPAILEPNWEHAGAFIVLDGVDSIEPGITFSEQRLLALNHDESQSYWLKLRVVAHKRTHRSITAVCPGAVAESGLAPKKKE